MAGVVWFDGPGASDVSLVGGKAANLAVLAGAGFRVPAGFTITTEAYQEFVSEIRGGIDAELATVDYQDPDQVEKVTSRIREIIMGAPVPAGIRAGIEQAYGELSVPLVAVRSSGTAEDLAEASFAGLHDTYLDITGTDEVLRAVQRCWASMWTARATAYRHHQGFDHQAVGIAVVVQTMIDAEVSGVMFTANPLTTATNEIVINASYGLGEAIVSGIVTPDQFVVKHEKLRVAEKTLGDKEIQIIRNDVTGVGTRELDVPQPEQAKFCMSDEDIRKLAKLGRDIQIHYEDFPQDVEWALSDGTFHVLQSRPITGAEFSWDADVDAENLGPEDDEVLWTRAWADQVTSGAVSPLMYSWRFINYSNVSYKYLDQVLFGTKRPSIRYFKFHKGELYYNCNWEREFAAKTGCPPLRPLQESMLPFVPPSWRSDIMASSFSWATYFKVLAKLHTNDPERTGYGIFKRLENWRANRLDETFGLDYDELAMLSDQALKDYVNEKALLEMEWISDSVAPFILYLRDFMGLLAVAVSTWYDGDNPNAYTELLSGSITATDTQIENRKLWVFSERIRASAVLGETFKRYRNGEFFERLGDSEEGREFLTDYNEFVREYAHRGPTDRDIIYPRRSEDPSLDYEAMAILLKANPSVDPEAKEQEINQRRDQTYREVVENIRRKPLGALKAEAFKILYHYVHKWIVLRDNERQNPTDRTVMAVKRGCVEVNRRLRERGIFDNDWDFYFLTRTELFRLLDGAEPNMKLVRAKIKARQRDFDRFFNKEVQPPMYLYKNAPIDLEITQESEDGVLRGTATSHGTVTATARVVKRLSEIGRVEPGEILVTNSTDPGWTPVFLIISGIVVETGGLLSHASSLAREYSLPAIQLPNAMQSIPDGATITVDGGSGEVRIVEEF